MKIVLLLIVVFGLGGCKNFEIRGGVTFPGGRLVVTRDGKTTVADLDLDGKTLMRLNR